MKADRNFRMKKSTKRLLGTLWDDPNRHDVKRLFIAAQVTQESARRRSDRNTRSERNETTD